MRARAGESGERFASLVGLFARRAWNWGFQVLDCAHAARRARPRAGAIAHRVVLDMDDDLNMLAREQLLDGGVGSAPASAPAPRTARGQGLTDADGRGILAAHARSRADPNSSLRARCR